MSAYRNVRKPSKSRVNQQIVSGHNQGRSPRASVSRFSKQLHSSQAKNMRFIGSILAALILIFGGFYALVGLIAGTWISLVNDSASASAVSYMIVLIIIIIYIAIIVFFAFYWRTLFHAGGEHLEKMDIQTEQNNRIIALMEENLNKEKGSEIVDEKELIQGSCPFCGQQVSSTHPGIHTCTKCKNRFQV